MRWIELEPDLADLYNAGIKQETPQMVLADRAVQCQQLRLLATAVDGVVAILKRLDGIERRLEKLEELNVEVH